MQKKTAVLIVLDGWGYREETDNNAIAGAQKPNWDRLWANYPHDLISGSGMDVGLPDGQMGNSEVGHVNLGAGRVVYQDFTKISKAIQDGDFFTNAALLAGIDQAVANGKAVHVMGLLSEGGVHSHDEHFQATIKLAVERGAQVYAHAFLDGRDTPPRSAQQPIEALQAVCQQVGNARLVSLIGRYFAMDRDNRWDRVQAAYDLLTQGKALFTATDPVAALQAAYERGENDEFVKATAIVEAGGQPVSMQDGDCLIFINFRADRAREISYAFVADEFSGFERSARPKLSTFVAMAEYAADLPCSVAFPAENLSNTLGEYLQNQGMTQLRLAETEKYAHVTFFFNGGIEQPFQGEDRIMVKSPAVATYDLQPEMSAFEVTDKLVAAIEGGQYDLIVCNYANADMVGHTGNYAAAVKAIEALDLCIGRVAAAVESRGAECLITADHGNADQMLDLESGQAHTAHTTNLVPLLYIGTRRDLKLRSRGVLSDIAPTLLQLKNLPVPAEMTGKSLILG